MYPVLARRQAASFLAAGFTCLRRRVGETPGFGSRKLRGQRQIPPLQR